MKKIETNTPGVWIIEPQVFGDCRGYFMETYSTRAFHELGIDTIFVQDNQSFTAQKGTLRGIHFQNAPMAQAKLVRVARGAVMDVAMSISSALSELKAVNPELTRRDLWKSGRNIGRDMVGTMTNTLILAFLGSGFTLIIYLYSLDLPWHELMSSSYLALEVVSGVASAIGVILSVPVTTILGAVLFTKRK